jgi:hypothetical protein
MVQTSGQAGFKIHGGSVAGQRPRPRRPRVSRRGIGPALEELACSRMLGSEEFLTRAHGDESPSCSSAIRSSMRKEPIENLFGSKGVTYVVGRNELSPM